MISKTGIFIVATIYC